MMPQNVFLALLAVFTIHLQVQGVPVHSSGDRPHRIAQNTELTPEVSIALAGVPPMDMLRPRTGVLQRGNVETQKEEREMGSFVRDLKLKILQTAHSTVLSHSPQGMFKPKPAHTMGRRHPQDNVFDTLSANSIASNKTRTNKNGEIQASCFPADVIVQVKNQSVQMQHIKVGDNVRTGRATTSDVFMFSHAIEGEEFEFVRLHTQHGSLSLSGGHFVYTPKGLIAAGSIRRGDFLFTDDGSESRVNNMETVFELGLYNPQTFDGSIVVNGFVVSTYTQTIPVGAAISLLAPMRSAYGILGMDITFGLVERENCLRKLANYIGV